MDDPCSSKWVGGSESPYPIPIAPMMILDYNENIRFLDQDVYYTMEFPKKFVL